MIASAVAAVAFLPFQVFASVGFACLACFLATMFRDPRRTVGDDIVAPADGMVREVDPERGFVSTYLALRNVHVTRAPMDGVIDRKTRFRGKHAPAFSRKTVKNERLELTLRSRLGDISIIQMTGAIARRIVPYVDEGQALAKGDKLSLIRFGSRVDLYLPPDKTKILVTKGQRLRAGVTRIAEGQNGRAE